MQVWYIYGSQTDEHLRAEVKGSEIVLVSRERRVTGVDTSWRDRVLATIPVDIWLDIAAKLDTARLSIAKLGGK